MCVSYEGMHFSFVLWNAIRCYASEAIYSFDFSSHFEKRIMTPECNKDLVCIDTNVHKENKRIDDQVSIPPPVSALVSDKF